MKDRNERRLELADLLERFNSAISRQEWQIACAYGLAAAPLAEDLCDFELMNFLGDNLERFNEFSVAGRLMGHAGRHFARAEGFEWNGNYVDGLLLIEQRVRHIGAPIRNAQLVPIAAKFAKNCAIVINPRLEKLYRRSFPNVDVYSSDDNQIAKLRINARAVASFETLMQYLAIDEQSLAQNFSALKPNLESVVQFRQAYCERETDRLVGIAWESTNNAKDLPELSCWINLVKATNAKFVSLQYGNVSENIKQFYERGAFVIHDTSVNSLGDLDQFAAQICALDAVITISNTTAHISGALGIPTVVLLDNKFHLTWPILGNRSPWYPNTRLVRKQSGTWTDRMSFARELLETKLKNRTSMWR